MESTTVKYFDGKSSVPQYIYLFLDKTIGEISFETINGDFKKLKIEEILFEKKGSILNLQFGIDPIENISIEDLDFIKDINTYRIKNGQLGYYQKLLNIGIKGYVLITLLIFSLIGTSYFFIIPWVAEKAVVLIPTTYDDSIGKAAFQQSILFDSIDDRKSKILNKFVQELQLNSTKKLKFIVVHSNIVNAYALPDGTIVVYSGILNKMENYEELVALIGHEVTHITNRHSIKMICRNLSGYLFVSAILGDVNGIMAVIGDNINTFQTLSFSRKFEREADLGGFIILKLNKINPKGMEHLFFRLKKEEFLSVPEFLSSHPITNNRINEIRKNSKATPYSFIENQNLKNLFKKLKK